MAEGEPGILINTGAVLNSMRIVQVSICEVHIGYRVRLTATRLKVLYALRYDNRNVCAKFVPVRIRNRVPSWSIYHTWRILVLSCIIHVGGMPWDIVLGS